MEQLKRIKLGDFRGLRDDTVVVDVMIPWVWNIAYKNYEITGMRCIRSPITEWEHSSDVQQVDEVAVSL
jgi:hypothetical protein